MKDLTKKEMVAMILYNFREASIEFDSSINSMSISKRSLLLYVRDNHDTMEARHIKAIMNLLYVLDLNNINIDKLNLHLNLDDLEKLYFKIVSDKYFNKLLLFHNELIKYNTNTTFNNAFFVLYLNGYLSIQDKKIEDKFYFYSEYKKDLYLELKKEVD